MIGSDTIDEDLRRQLDVREGSLSHHFDTIGESGGGAVCPTRAAVLRDMLVAIARNIFQAVDVSGIIGRWEIADVGVRKWAHNMGVLWTWSRLHARIVEVDIATFPSLLDQLCGRNVR